MSNENEINPSEEIEALENEFEVSADELLDDMSDFEDELDEMMMSSNPDKWEDQPAENQEDTESAESSMWLQQPLLTGASLDWEKLIWATILILTIVSRFWGLGDRVMSHDESLHTHYSFQYFNGDGYSHTPLMHGPFLFHVTAFSYWLFGANDFTARIPIALFGVLMVFIPWFMRHWIGRTGAIFAGIILLISPYSLYYSRYIRHDVYVIVWALIIMMGMFYYFKNRDDRSVYWIAAGLALMYATKEVSFIYTAIFGSFIVFRLLFKIGNKDWFKNAIFSINFPTILIIIGLLTFGGAFGYDQLVLGEEAVEGAAEVAQSTSNLLGVLQVFGLFALSGGLFFLADGIKDQLSKFAEFDLVVVFTTFVLPMMVPLLVNFLGKDPQNYNFNRCPVPGAESLSAFQESMFRISDPACRQLLIASPVFTTLLLMFVVLAISVYVGLWWNARIWVPAAVVFHVLFAVLYTSVFSNPWGWMTGAVGSLGYWLDQQEVARGGQPWFYYLFVTPFYEFMAVTFSWLAIRMWARKNGLRALGRYWGWVTLIGLVAMGLVNWYYNGVNLLTGDAFNRFPGLATFAAVLGFALIGWFVLGDNFGRNDKKEDILYKRLQVDDWFGFVPFSIFWLIGAYFAYTAAGEKMPWLSIHLVIPMAFLVGYYFNEVFKEFEWSEFVQEKSLIFFGLATLLIAAAALLIGPIFTGEIRFGDQTQEGLNSVGRFMGLLVLTGFIGYLLYQRREQVPLRLRQVAWTFSSFVLLGLLTVRFAWMASFPNADYTTEYLVYAHGAPATSNAVMPQLEELSKRLYGDMRLKIYYDNEASWPYTWYLRDFTDRVYFGENPSPDVRNADAVLVGDANYSKVEPFLEDDFEYMEFTFLWWPMEEYRDISWDSVLGNPGLEGTTQETLINSSAKRRGLWNIFFYRDYTEYGLNVGRDFAVGSWPLKRNMRLYIRRDALGTLWDRGVGATVIEAPVDPYAVGERPFEPNLVAGQGILSAPRNVAVAANGNMYVADSGNHRIQVLDPAGAPIFSFGENGGGEGQFFEPWGVAVDEGFVYVSDTWNNRVQKFTLEGQFVTMFGISGSPEDPTTGGGQFYGPRDILLGPDNTLFVTDTGNHRVQMFDRDGQFLSAIGGQGVRGGEFFEPVGLAVAPDGSIFVADTWNGRVQEFIMADQQIFPVNEFDVEAWDKSQSINNKPYITVDPVGNILITDPEGYRVIAFDRAGNYIGRFGTFTGNTSGFSLPNGIATDSQGQVYVTDAELSVVYRFDAVNQ
ncbi:MAG: flippase activity-associated protein Agl23 [Chloroflexota bacterium]